MLADFISKETREKVLQLSHKNLLKKLEPKVEAIQRVLKKHPYALYSCQFCSCEEFDALGKIFKTSQLSNLDVKFEPITIN